MNYVNVKCRVGGGFWRRGGETPLPVKWEDRIIEIREGSWSYIAGSIGRSPGMVYLYLNQIPIDVVISLGSFLTVGSLEPYYKF